MRLARLSLFAQSALYLCSGINHFWHESFYLRIMPDHYSNPAFPVQLSGVAEIAGGIGLLIPATRRVAALGIALMLFVFFDVHIFMLQHAERFSAIPLWILWARIPLQFALIGWALAYARNSGHSRPGSLA
jgi:uncharacterized membrane protein